MTLKFGNSKRLCFLYLHMRSNDYLKIYCLWSKTIDLESN